MNSYLDHLAQCAPMCRETYGNDPDSKPNDHCVWKQTGHFHEIWEWVETDAHFRERVKAKTEDGK